MTWRRWWKEASLWGSLLLLLAAFGGVVWATHHPAHPALARAAGWPLVGPVVERFRASYGVGVDPAPQAPETARGAEEGGGVEWSYVPEEGVNDSRIVPPRRAAAGEAVPGAARSGPGHVWVAPGEEVRESPAPSARLLGHQAVFERLEVLERSEDWVKVASGAGEGWVRAPSLEEADYPLGAGLVPTKPLPGARPDSSELRAALDLLGVAEPSGRLGPYPLYTDVRPVSTLFRLDRAASQAEAVYRQRYGRPLEGDPAEAVLVFAEEGTYRLYQTREARLQGLPAGGHSGRGLVALWVGDRTPHEIAATLLHELAHVLNRRAVGPALPPWLDEGMAEDLSLSQVTESGDLRPERLGGATVRRAATVGPGRIEYQGAIASLRSLNAAFARSGPPRLEELLSLDWDRFVRSDDRTLHYAHAGYFIRYLVETPELAEGFRRFLDRVAAGGPATGPALREDLDRTWQQLDDGLAQWVRDKVLETTLEASGGRARAGDPGTEPPPRTDKP